MYVVPGAAKQVVFAQDLVYGGKIVGRSLYRVRESASKFVQYEPLINSLSFITSCKIKTQQLKAVMAKLKMDVAKTSCSVDTEKELLIMHKRSAKVDKMTCVEIYDISGQKLDVNVSSNHLTAAAGACDLEDVELKFSGSKALGQMILGPTLTTYFMPFNVE
jgi:hypothetical protein